MTICESIIGVESKDQWQKALNDVPHSFWHTWWAMRALQKQTGSPGYLYLCEDSASGCVAACPFMEREWHGSVDIYTPAGFMGFISNGNLLGLRQRWDAFVNERGYVCGYFALHPLLSTPEHHVGIEITNDLYVLDLTSGLESVFMRLSQNVKRTLTRWERCNASLVTEVEPLIEFLLENYEPFMRRMNARPTAIWSRNALNDMCRNPDALIMGAADNDGLCAVVAFGVTDHCAEYQLNVNVREGRKYTAPLIWAGIQRLMDMSIPNLHLGGGIKPNDGVAMAKERYGPTSYPLMTAQEVYDSVRYEELCKESGADARATCNRFFPAYRAGIEIGDPAR